MVTRKKPAPAPQLHPPRRDAAGIALCNVVASCEQPAALQVAVACSGCQDVIDSTTALIERKRAELVGHDAHVAAILDAADRDDRTLSDTEKLAIAAAGPLRQQLGSDVEKLTAEQAAVLEEHTHPVFTCDKHVKQIPA